MTAADFFNLPTNKATVNKLYAISQSIFNSENPETHVFFNEVAGCLKQYLGYRKCIKAITDKPTTESVYNSYKKLKKAGYRKELILPF